MSALIRYPSFYLAAPILLSCLVTLASYDLPASYLPGVALLGSGACATILIDRLRPIKLPGYEVFTTLDFRGTREALVACSLATVILTFCFIDVGLFPIPLIVDPSSYATFQNGRMAVRHISDMSWALPPIALLCLRRPWLQAVFIAIGLIFPILVLDRNRLLAAVYSLIMVLVLRRQNKGRFPWILILGAGLMAAGAFSILGIVRSGTLNFLTLPFSTIFSRSPAAVQWILLYSSAGIYNFSAILAKDYHNASFLINQVVPLQGSVATLGTDIPLDARTVNVGTEFFPFLMAFGGGGALVSLFLLYAMMIWAVHLVRTKAGLFRILIFLRVSYVTVMAPFAPQAFTWTNFDFLILCIILQDFAQLLPRRQAFP